MDCPTGQYLKPPTTGGATSKTDGCKACPSGKYASGGVTQTCRNMNCKKNFQPGSKSGMSSATQGCQACGDGKYSDGGITMCEDPKACPALIEKNIDNECEMNLVVVGGGAGGVVFLVFAGVCFVRARRRSAYDAHGHKRGFGYSAADDPLLGE
jgi:hypothetical protein